MNALLKVGIIGLGVMGQRIQARVANHSRLRATQVCDADPGTVARMMACVFQPIVDAVSG